MFHYRFTKDSKENTNDVGVRPSIRQLFSTGLAVRPSRFLKTKAKSVEEKSSLEELAKKSPQEWKKLMEATKIHEKFIQSLGFNLGSKDVTKPASTNIGTLETTQSTAVPGDAIKKKPLSSISAPPRIGLAKVCGVRIQDGVQQSEPFGKSILEVFKNVSRNISIFWQFVYLSPQNVAQKHEFSLSLS